MDDPVTPADYRQRVVELAEELRELPEAERARLLKRIERGDPKLHARVVIRLMEIDDS